MYVFFVVFFIGGGGSHIISPKGGINILSAVDTTTAHSSFGILISCVCVCVCVFCFLAAGEHLTLEAQRDVSTS